jgi:hypothetical protein
VGSSLTPKSEKSLKKFSRFKQSSLFYFTVSDEERNFKMMTPGVNVIKLVSFIADDEAK